MGKYLVTGAAGYLAGRVMAFLSEWEGCERLVGLDVKEEPPGFPGQRYHRADIRSPETTDIIAGESPDVVIHFAYVVEPSHDPGQEQSVNIGGLLRVLEAVRRSGCRRLLVTSSTSAYGAYPGIPLFQDEEGPLRIHPRFPYQRDKVLTELICDRFLSENPGVDLTVIRPAIVVGPEWSNFWTALFFLFPLMPRIVGCETQFQFIHEDDLVQLYRLCLAKGAPGTFNAAADGAVTVDEVADITGDRLVPMHAEAVKAALWVAHNLRLLPVGTPPGAVEFFCYPWVASNRKAKRVLGFVPTHDSREAFEEAAAMKPRLLENLSEKSRPGFPVFDALLKMGMAHSRRTIL